METAKVFTSGRSQAVRIPKGYRFGAEINEVYVNKILPEKMKYNLEYLSSFSVGGDLRLMFATFTGVVK